MTRILYSTTDNSEGQLSAGITAASTSIILKAVEGAEFPQPYTGSTSSAGDNNTLNDTGALGSLAVGDFIRNVTDGSWAYVKTLTSADTIETTPLRGGTDNLWQSGDEWQVNEFIITIEKRDADGDVTAREKILIKNRSTDTLTVRTRAYDGSTAQAFDADDYVNLHVVSNHIEHLIDCFYDAMIAIETGATTTATLIIDLASTDDAKGASLIGIEDDGTLLDATNVEEALQEIQGDLDLLEAAAVTLSSVGLYGSGGDGAVTWSSSTDLDPDTTYKYTTATLNAGQTLSVDEVNKVQVILNTGNVTINGTVNLDAKGGASTTDGNTFLAVVGAGAGGDGSTDGVYYAGGGGGASGIANGNAGSSAGGGSVGGAAGVTIPAVLAMVAGLLRGVTCGGGGGTANGAAGGAGGGALVWFIGGNLTLGADSVITADGAAGGSGNGKGGGGGGGMVFILVAGTVTDGGVEVTASAGAAGGALAGAGAAGKIVIYSLSTGTLIKSA